MSASGIARLAARRGAAITERLSAGPPSLPDPSSLPLLDISVVTFNSARWVDGFVASLLGQRYPPDKIRLIVVDHGSTDDTAGRLEDAARRHGAGLRGFEIHRRPNRGFGAGHNFALRRSETPLALVSNVDIEFEPDALVRAVAQAQTDAADVVSWEFRQKPYEHPRYYDPVTLETQCSSHACVLLRRSAVAEVGGYDERIFMYGEDIELSFRLRDRGYRLAYSPGAVVWHYWYDPADPVKPLQFFGSRLADAYIRLRYGSAADIRAIPDRFARLWRETAWMPARQALFARTAASLLANAPFFLFRRRRSRIPFPFSGDQYALEREGAFCACRKEADGAGALLVSVIVRTARGRRPWLQECLATILNQTYPHIEIALVEAGSMTLEEEAARWRAASAAPVVYDATADPSPAAAANRGLALASGRLLMIVDDGALLFADHVESLVSELGAHPDSRAACAFAWRAAAKRAAEGECFVETAHAKPPGCRPPFDPSAFGGEGPFPNQAVLFRRELYEALGGLNPAAGAACDVEFWTRCREAGDFAFVEKTTSITRR